MDSRTELSTRISELAGEVADELFTDGDGYKSERLVIERNDGVAGGGWCRDAVATRIQTMLEILGARKLIDATEHSTDSVVVPE